MRMSLEGPLSSTSAPALTFACPSSALAVSRLGPLARLRRHRGELALHETGEGGLSGRQRVQRGTEVGAADAALHPRVPGAHVVADRDLVEVDELHARLLRRVALRVAQPQV